MFYLSGLIYLPIYLVLINTTVTLTIMKMNAANDHKGSIAKNNDSMKSAFISIEKGRKSRQDKIKSELQAHWRTRSILYGYQCSYS